MLDDPTPDDPSGDVAFPDDEDPPPSSTEMHAARARRGDPLSWQTLETKVRQMLQETFGRRWSLRRSTLEDLIQVTLGDICRDFGKFKAEAGSGSTGTRRRARRQPHFRCR